MPVDFAEHHVAGEDHHFGRGLAFFGDRQRVAGRVQAQAADQTVLVEVATVGHAGMQAVAGQIVHLVDVDRTGKDAGQNARSGPPGLVREQVDHVARIDLPLVAQCVGNVPFEQEAVGKQLVRGNAGQAHVFDRMAKRPVPQVVQQGRHDQQLGVGRHDRRGESLVVAQMPQAQQGQPVHAHRVLEARVMRRRVHEGHEPQLADPGQPAELGRVHERPDARR